MRASFFKTIERVAEERKDIYVLTADLGFGLFDGIKQRCPGRFLDIGVAEANMIGLSAGLALCGKRVYCYSIIPFLVMRAYEQIRNDVAYHNLNVKLVGVGGGFTYGLEGITHFGLEDMALMRALPNMSVVAPADPYEAESLAEISVLHAGPLYVRLGKTGDPCVHNGKPEFKIGRAMILNEGKEVALFATGSMVYPALQALKMLKGKGLNATLVNMHSVKPLDEDVVRQVAATHDMIFSVEEHYLHGGLGSAIAEVLSAEGSGCVLNRLGINEGLSRPVGGSEYLRDQYGLSPDKIFKSIMRKVEAGRVWK